jgi:hypothetical protein
LHVEDGYRDTYQESSEKVDEKEKYLNHIYCCRLFNDGKDGKYIGSLESVPL